MKRNEMAANVDLPSWLQDEAQHELRATLTNHRFRWLVTGAAGFIGSNLVETLLLLGQDVRGLDNFATGHWRNLHEVKARVGEAAWGRFVFHAADIRDAQACEKAVKGVDFVLHQAALGSVPRSVKDPKTTNDVNISGFLTMLDAARLAGVKRFVYAASSSTYGDEPNLPKREERIGNPLSPYAVTKLVNELYASVYSRTYDFHSIGLRYFNAFGPRQDPDGAYAAVIPKWISAMLAGDDVQINGDGETSRDFCYVGNVVQANLRAALVGELATSEVYNVAVGGRTTLNDLFSIIKAGLATHGFHYGKSPTYQPFRAGDVRHSQAEVAKAVRELGFTGLFDLRRGMTEALPWYLAFVAQERASA